MAQVIAPAPRPAPEQAGEAARLQRLSGEPQGRHGGDLVRPGLAGEAAELLADLGAKDLMAIDYPQATAARRVGELRYTKSAITVS